MGTLLSWPQRSQNGRPTLAPRDTGGSEWAECRRPPAALLPYARVAGVACGVGGGTYLGGIRALAALGSAGRLRLPARAGERYRPEGGLQGGRAAGGGGEGAALWGGRQVGRRRW